MDRIAHPSYDLAAVRARIPILGHAIPMNACSQGPLCDATRDAAADFLASWNEKGMDWESWMSEVDLSRREFAGLIGADPEEIAAVTSVSHAVTVLASALDFGGQRNVVVTTSAEFPTVGHVWLAQEQRGAQLRWVPMRDGAVEVEDYVRAIDDHTVLVSVPHGVYLDGFMPDVAEITRVARERGAYVFVDAYQTLGTAPFDVRAAGIDFLAGGTIKFLMGTAGIAFLYVRRELIDRLHPTVTGWFGRANPFAFDAMRLDWSPTATRFEAGTPSVFSAYVSRAGMALVRELGLPQIGAWNAVLSHRLVERGQELGLTIFGPGVSRPKTQTTAFLCHGDSSEMEAALRRRGVIGSARGPVIRLAPHFYSTLDDVDAALDALAAVNAPLASRRS